VKPRPDRGASRCRRIAKLTTRFRIADRRGAAASQGARCCCAINAVTSHRGSSAAASEGSGGSSRRLHLSTGSNRAERQGSPDCGKRRRLQTTTSAAISGAAAATCGRLAQRHHQIRRGTFPPGLAYAIRDFARRSAGPAYGERRALQCWPAGGSGMLLSRGCCSEADGLSE
jgi:hypothetical protein